ncbi:unnamed protein product [Pleuronectes platessa]|uniref:Histone H2A n=1 Tax=Pleuronectes platessa TaxID=8262 RepID=A0A9N7YNW9_PLEPL|nr:unnamed protein product [Pleuronectes platessa]
MKQHTTSNIRLCPECRTGYIMSDDLHPRCESCLGPEHAGRALTPGANCAFCKLLEESERRRRAEAYAEMDGEGFASQRAFRLDEAIDFFNNDRGPESADSAPGAEEHYPPVGSPLGTEGKSTELEMSGRGKTAVKRVLRPRPLLRPAQFPWPRHRPAAQGTMRTGWERSSGLPGAVLEYLTAEILELAERSRDNKKSRIIPRHCSSRSATTRAHQALKSPSLRRSAHHIQAVLLPKKTEKARQK